MSNDLQLNAVLNNVAFEVFQELAFIFPAEGERDHDPACERTTSAVIFEGAHAGGIILALPTQMLCALASNMLGLDETAPPTPEQQVDALKELANVLCGNLLPAIYGPEAEYRVHSPLILASAPADAHVGYLCRRTGAAQAANAKIKQYAKVPEKTA